MDATSKRSRQNGGQDNDVRELVQQVKLLRLKMKQMDTEYSQEIQSLKDDFNHLANDHDEEMSSLKTTCKQEISKLKSTVNQQRQMMDKGGARVLKNPVSQL